MTYSNLTKSQLIAKIHSLEEAYRELEKESHGYLDQIDSLQEENNELGDLKEACTCSSLSNEDYERIEIAKSLKISYERLSLGVNTEIDEIISLTNQLIELHQ